MTRVGDSSVAETWAHARADARRDELADPVAAGYELARTRSGDLSSVLGIASGTSMMALGGADPRTRSLIGASMVAGGVDTVIQMSRWLAGRDDATFGSTLYAATGVLPGASLLAVGALKHTPSRAEALRVGLLGANLAVIAWELATRGPDIVRGEEDVSGLLAFGAAFSGLAMPLRRL